MKKPPHFKTLPILALCGSFQFASAGTLVLNPFADGFDVSSGISNSINSTHLIDVRKDADTANINGVIFDNTVGAGNYTLSPGGGNFGGNNSPADNASGLDVLMNNFHYGGNPSTLELRNLTPGQEYKLRLYVGGWGGALQDFTFDDTAVNTVVTGVARNAGNNAVPGSIDYTYTLGAADTDLFVRIDPQNPGDTFHWYGFSNEAVPEPSSTALLGLGGIALLLRRRR